MSHYNRIELLDFTLKTISQSQHNDYEVIVVDDFSNKSNDPETLKSKYTDVDLHIIKMEDSHKIKDYTNPCIPYNIGFGQARGDKIIIQNPECCHMGDVISYTERNLTNDEYLSFHCYASTQDDLIKIHQGEPITFNNLKKPGVENGIWYNHEKYRKFSFHFTTAITRTNLIKLNGFDERFASGVACDDVEFIHRVKLSIPTIKFVHDPYTIHQYHPKIYYNIPNQAELHTNNKNLLKQIQKHEATNIRAHNNGKTIIS